MRRIAMLLLLIPLASAHVPDFDGAGSRPDTATVVDDPTKSWVFFGEMSAGEQWYRLDLEAGDELFVSLSTPVGQETRLGLWLTPDTLENGTQVAAIDDVGVEPFTPVALRTVAESRTTVNETQTVYAVVVAASEAQFALGIGARESFTPVEWVRVPVDRIAIQAWAGVPWAWALAGEVLAIGIVTWRYRSPEASVMLQRLGAGIILGSAGTTTILTMIAVVQGGAGLGIIIPLVFIASAVAIGLAAWRLRRPWTHALLGVAALVAWAGLWLGPVLLFASSAWPRRADGSD